jgi:hypothetical protein
MTSPSTNDQDVLTQIRKLQLADLFWSYSTCQCCFLVVGLVIVSSPVHTYPHRHRQYPKHKCTFSLTRLNKAWSISFSSTGALLDCKKKSKEKPKSLVAALQQQCSSFVWGLNDRNELFTQKQTMQRIIGTNDFNFSKESSKTWQHRGLQSWENFEWRFAPEFDWPGKGLSMNTASIRTLINAAEVCYHGLLMTWSRSAIPSSFLKRHADTQEQARLCQAERNL